MDFVHPVEAVIPGAQGRVLAVLAETTAELNLRTVARLASVSPAQASRVLPVLVELGLVERREVPPSSQFRLNREHIAGRLVIELARSREAMLDRMGAAACDLPISPASVIVFGSFARREADAQSDIDVLIIRPDGIDEDDAAWVAGTDQWRDDIAAIAGNAVEILEADRVDVAKKLSSKSALWRDVVRDGIVVHGETIHELRGAVRA